MQAVVLMVPEGICDLCNIACAAWSAGADASVVAGCRWPRTTRCYKSCSRMSSAGWCRCSHAPPLAVFFRRAACGDFNRAWASSWRPLRSNKRRHDLNTWPCIVHCAHAGMEGDLKRAPSLALLSSAWTSACASSTSWGSALSGVRSTNGQAWMLPSHGLHMLTRCAALAL
jgi:hypothetical protein